MSRYIAVLILVAVVLAASRSSDVDASRTANELHAVIRTGEADAANGVHKLHAVIRTGEADAANGVHKLHAVIRTGEADAAHTIHTPHVVIRTGEADAAHTIHTPHVVIRTGEADAAHTIHTPHVVIRTGEPDRRLIGVVGHNAHAICQEVHYKTLCSTLTTLPGVATPQQLLDAALRVAATKAAVAETRLGEALKSPKAKGTAMSSSLESCKQSYASLVASLQSARDKLKSGGSHDDIMSELSAAGTFSTDCEDIFDERPELKSPIPGAQRHVSRLVNNCLDLAATIKQ